ncbi:hypothetical protein CQR47_0769 [Bifidobacterium thermophilum]|uniref:Uncharacterized protein n=1 Tax=Bifidobacterium thermophilum TaxID=33905 RepID=A0A2N3QML4_9BIFI|nr:hypothetical protein CQR47_0769 [Bifidobacterium thermophilum]
MFMFDASLRCSQYTYILAITMVLAILSAKVCPRPSHNGQKNPMPRDTISARCANSLKPILLPDIGIPESWSTTWSRMIR